MKDLLRPGSVLVVLGAGGVGKTTVAAALGVAAARTRLRTAVITIDPARRLREALGVPRLGRKPTRIDARRLTAAGLDPALRLFAMVLDVKGEWDAMVAEHVSDPAARRRILDNAFYRSLSSQFAGSDAYAALEALHDLHAGGGYDLEVVDTPPAAHAFEFVEAPARLTRLLDSRAARWLLRPAGESASLALRLAGRVAGYVARELERFAGGHTLASIADFFTAAGGATGHITARMHKVSALLRSPAVRFVLVTTAEPDRLRQTGRLVERLESEGLHLGAIVVNRFLDEAVWGGGPVIPADGAERAHGRRRGRAMAAFDSIARLRAALSREDSGHAGVQAALAHLESCRARADDDARRLRRFIEALPARARVTVLPELSPGTAGLEALALLASHLLAPAAGIERPARHADRATAATKGEHPSHRRNSAHGRGRQGDGIGRMPE